MTQPDIEKTAAGRDLTILLRLFVTGSSQRSFRAIEAVQSLCREYFGNGATLEIIDVDVLEQPEKAEEEKILATPTLICLSPGPRRRLVGDFGDTGRIVVLLGLKDQVRPKVEE